MVACLANGEAQRDLLLDATLVRLTEALRVADCLGLAFVVPRAGLDASVA